MKNNRLKVIKDKAYNNRSLFLTGGAVIGLGTSIFFTARGQMKADEIMAEKRASGEFDETTGKKEKFKATWKCYVPVMISGVLTLICIVTSQYISRKEIAGLAASLGVLAANRDNLEKAIKEKYGEDALVELREKILPYKKPEVKDGKKEDRFPAEETGNGDLLCYEGYSGRWFRSSKEAVEEAEEAYNLRFKDGEYLSYNDFYELLGIEASHFGHQFGYPNPIEYYNNENGIEFENSIFYDEEIGENVLYIDVFTYPFECWFEY